MISLRNSESAVYLIGFNTELLFIIIKILKVAIVYVEIGKHKKGHCIAHYAVFPSHSDQQKYCISHTYILCNKDIYEYIK